MDKTTINGNAHGNKRATAKKRVVQKPLRLMRFLFFTTVALTVVIIIIACVKENNILGITPQPPTESIFKEDVTVMGLSIGGMTISQAKSALQEQIRTELSNVNIVLREADASYTLTAVDMSIRTNLDDVLQNAIEQGDGDTITFKGDPLAIKFIPDPDTLAQRIGVIAGSFNTDPVEPTFEAKLSEGNKPEFIYVEGKDGRVLDEAATVQAVLALIENNELQGVVQPTYTSVAPMTSVDALKENTKFRAKYTTRYKRSSSDEVVKNRCFNIQKGADLLNGCILQPGEEFSFNGYVGLRSEAAGWKLANGISGGKEYTLQAGGGICQVSTTLYNAILSANVKVTYRKPHSIPSDYVPKGLDATVDSSGIDLNFMNDTYAPLYIFAYVSKDPESSSYLNLTVELYGEPLPNGTVYKPKSELLEEIPREDTVYTDDPTIPRGYQLTKVVRRDGYVAEAFLEEYQDGKLVNTVSLGQSKYRGNSAEISVGTGDPMNVTIPVGAEKIPRYFEAQEVNIPVLDETQYG